MQAGGMRTKKIASPFFFLLFFIGASLPLQTWASEPLFYESFDETFEGRWIVSEKKDYKALRSSRDRGTLEQYDGQISQRKPEN